MSFTCPIHGHFEPATNTSVALCPVCSLRNTLPPADYPEVANQAVYDALLASQAEVKRLRQGLWDCATAAGIDTDGDTTPDHLAYPDIVDYALEAVSELRKDYLAALDEVPLGGSGS